ncbi:hypothetical protein [Eleftheria terrae]|uniref:hypothetical protein n=1 Tax=Eleftheria terrae TaxID=1597781 RepID=UPI00263A8852|nr:hypothetical protein [Eleftheria terrae]WKB52471.1 hypothetical protein N7L95_22170 [Eleftheria terrae]
MSARLVLLTLHLPRERRVKVELRGGRWLTDDPARALRWHDGPFSTGDGTTALRIANDQDAALVLAALDPATVERGACGAGRLIEAAEAADGGCEIRWEVIEVVD